jgi:hypothetical protein
MHHFWRQTSIFERMSGLLCDAVCFGMGQTPAEQEYGQTRLETLKHGAFV